MDSVDRHPVDPARAARFGAESEEDVHELLASARKNGNMLRSLARCAHEWAGYLAVTAPDSPALTDAVRLAAQAWTAIFARASRTEEVTCPLGVGEPVRYAPTGPIDAAHAGHFRVAWMLAASVRDAASLSTLGEVPIEVLRRSGISIDECFYLFAGALQGFARRERDTPERLIGTLEATDPARVTIAPDWVLDLLVPEIDLLFQLMRRDGPAFDVALGKALACHRGFWSRGTYANDPTGFFAAGPTALAALAIDQGLPVHVRSDYLPQRLMRGT